MQHLRDFCHHCMSNHRVWQVCCGAQCQELTGYTCGYSASDSFLVQSNKESVPIKSSRKKEEAEKVQEELKRRKPKHRSPGQRLMTFKYCFTCAFTKFCRYHFKISHFYSSQLFSFFSVAAGQQKIETQTMFAKLIGALHSTMFSWLSNWLSVSTKRGCVSFLACKVKA